MDWWGSLTPLQFISKCTVSLFNNSVHLNLQSFKDSHVLLEKYILTFPLFVFIYLKDRDTEGRRKWEREFSCICWAIPNMQSTAGTEIGWRPESRIICYFPGRHWQEKMDCTQSEDLHLNTLMWDAGVPGVIYPLSLICQNYFLHLTACRSNTIIGSRSSDSKTDSANGKDEPYQVLPAPSALCPL